MIAKGVYVCAWGGGHGIVHVCRDRISFSLITATVMPSTSKPLRAVAIPAPLPRQGLRGITFSMGYTM